MALHPTDDRVPKNAIVHLKNPGKKDFALTIKNDEGENILYTMPAGKVIEVTGGIANILIKRLVDSLIIASTDMLQLNNENFRKRYEDDIIVKVSGAGKRIAEVVEAGPIGTKGTADEVIEDGEPVDTEELFDSLPDDADLYPAPEKDGDEEGEAEGEETTDETDPAFADQEAEAPKAKAKAKK